MSVTMSMQLRPRLVVSHIGMPLDDDVMPPVLLDVLEPPAPPVEVVFVVVGLGSVSSSHAAINATPHTNTAPK